MYEGQNVLRTALLGASALVLALATNATPALTAEGEFANQCAMGLALGKSVDTPCEITWKSDDGKTYCFGVDEAKSAFLKDSKQNLAKAQEYYQSTVAK